MHAYKFLVESKVAVACPAHEHLVMLNPDPVPAYRRASYMWKRDAALRDAFSSCRELTDAIQAAFLDDVSGACPHGDCPFDAAFARAWS